ncbi:MAG: acetyl-CoA C-acyltransferase [Planctomycetota bacterium]|nr:acetyl-CoA C-acyltransferase [Planctomycetota bacterium]
MKEVVIASIARTPIGSLQGTLSSVPAVQLGATAIKAAVERARIEPNGIDEVLMGQVVTAGVGQAPARQAALGAGLPNSVPCSTINKVCGSGLKSVMMARQAITAGATNVAVAGGMESMSLAPYLLPEARSGHRMGNKSVVDSMMHDGLWDPYGDKPMGDYGELCASEKSFSREAQDAYSIRSYERAVGASESGAFDDEIVPIEVPVKRQTQDVARDEEPTRFRPDKIPQLRPVFAADGTITAANASKISDGAAAVVLMSREEAEKRGAPILARIVSDASFAQEPEWFTTAPVGAVKKALELAELSADAIDIYEINEAFAVVAMAAIQELGLDEERVNIRGGAISLGHPIGCSGARILVTLVNAMRSTGKRYGCVSLCIGGGEAVAMVLESLC